MPCYFIVTQISISSCLIWHIIVLNNKNSKIPYCIRVTGIHITTSDMLSLERDLGIHGSSRLDVWCGGWISCLRLLLGSQLGQYYNDWIISIYNGSNLQQEKYVLKENW